MVNLTKNTQVIHLPKLSWLATRKEKSSISKEMLVKKCDSAKEDKSC